MRDQNGFKCHTQSESHVRQMLLIGEDPRKHISDYSAQFQRDFLQLLRTSHGEKKININHFYQEYIHNKEHIHMNATRWSSLTEFAKFLGTEGLCRIEDGDKGLEVAWIDNSPEALRRQDAIRKKERQDKGDEEREQRLIAEQIERARRDAAEDESEDIVDKARTLQRDEGEKIKLNFGGKAGSVKQPSPTTAMNVKDEDDKISTSVPEDTKPTSPPLTGLTPQPEKVTLKLGTSNKPKNVFSAASKKNALGGAKSASKETPRKPMSEAERIMKEEIERKRLREANGFSGLNVKRQKVS
ncbi:hypothetical protein MMC24_004520 [Lignoscripta atroalba]|nr:hypothetical protein [Lignoscripta atroalba]